MDENKKVYYIGKTGVIEEGELINTSYVIRKENGRTYSVRRIYSSVEEAEDAFLENGCKKKKDLNSIGVRSPFANMETKIKMLELKLAVLDEVKMNKPWIFRAIGKLFSKKVED